MAYINQDDKKIIANAIKKQFPTDKFTFSVRDLSCLTVKIKQSEIAKKLHGMVLSSSDLYGDEVKVKLDCSELEINIYWFREHFNEFPEFVKYIESIIKIIEQKGEWYNNTNIQTDYFDTAFYFKIVVCLKDV